MHEMANMKKLRKKNKSKNETSNTNEAVGKGAFGCKLEMSVVVVVIRPWRTLYSLFSGSLVLYFSFSSIDVIVFAIKTAYPNETRTASVLYELTTRLI